MQSHFRTLSHITAGQTERGLPLRKKAHVWKTSNLYFPFLFYFLCGRKIKEMSKESKGEKKNRTKKGKKKRSSVVIGFDYIPVLSSNYPSVPKL